MCRKTRLWGLFLSAMGLGLMLSSLFGSIVLQLLLGIGLLTVGVLMMSRR